MYKVCGLVMIGGPVSGQVQYHSWYSALEASLTLCWWVWQLQDEIGSLKVPFLRLASTKSGLGALLNHHKQGLSPAQFMGMLLAFSSSRFSFHDAVAWLHRSLQ